MHVATLASTFKAKGKTRNTLSQEEFAYMKREMTKNTAPIKILETISSARTGRTILPKD